MTRRAMEPKKGARLQVLLVSRVKEPKMLKIVISGTIVSIACTVLVGIAATSLISL
jgi:hypothetical protein